MGQELWFKKTPGEKARKQITVYNCNHLFTAVDRKPAAPPAAALALIRRTVTPF